MIEAERSVAVGELEDLLERERRALLAARFDLLERLADEKQRLVSTVARMRPTKATLERLDALARRNAALFRASLAGIGRARDRALAIAGAAELRTYDREGRLHRSEAPVRSRLSRRA
ncbi:MAG: hypothetical protein D6811_05390 [Alphaproteobacteria bacterium]|nr:MAG: hypothetical protein D6811_05390 [Alphaproteobacteria bacterium]